MTSSQSKQRFSLVEGHVLDEIPQDERGSWVGPALILAGITACIPALLIGYVLVSMMPLQSAIVAIVVVYVIVGIGQTFSAIRGQQVGRPLTMILRDALGSLGSRVLTSLIVTLFGLIWFGIQSQITGGVFHSVLGGPSVAWWTVIVGVVMLLTACVGYELLKYVNFLAVPALILLTGWAIWYVTQTLGAEALTDYQPAAPGSFIAGVALIVGLLAYAIVSPADYTRYTRSPGHATIAVWASTVPVGIFFAVGGAVIGIIGANLVPGNPSDISLALVQLGYPVVAMGIVFLGAWTTNVANAYIGGLGLSNMFNLHVSGRFWATLIGGGVGTVLGALGILGALQPVATVTGIAAAPLLGILIAEVITRRTWRERPGINVAGMTAWGLGAITALLTGFFFDFFIFPVNGAIVSLVSYLVLQKWRRESTAVKQYAYSADVA